MNIKQLFLINEKIYYKLILLSIFLIPIFSKAFIYKIDILEKDGQKIYLMSDFHPRNDKDKQQVDDLITIINNLNAFTICENVLENYRNIKNDSHSYWLKLGAKLADGFIPKFHEYYFKKCSKEKKYNMEFRVQQDYFDMFSSYTIDHVLKEAESQLEEIEGYDDSIILNELYKLIIKDIKSRLSILTKYKNYNKKSCDKDKTFQKATKKEAQQFFVNDNNTINFCTFNYYIMEAKAIHTIYNNKNDNIFIIAGGAHNITLEDMLTKLLGYKKIKSFGKPYRDLYGKVINPDTIPDTLDIKECFDKMNQSQSKKILSKL